MRIGPLTLTMADLHTDTQRVERPMCDYLHTIILDGEPIRRACQRASAFWVQSLLSTHNSHACAHHLPRIVREIEKCAAQFDILKPGTRTPDMRYARTDRKDGQSGRITREESNYARVTVKPYTGKAR